MNFRILLISIYICLLAVPSGFAAEEHTLFTQILSDHVDAGLVRYQALCSDQRLGTYIEYLAQADPDGILDRNSRLAFWINAYNAYTLKIVCDHYPIKTINQLHTGGLIVGTAIKRTVWDKPLVTIHNEKTTLNSIEQKIIRKEFKDARVHFALVCAAKSCPQLRNEAYEGNKLNEQLNDQGRKFLTEPDKNSFDLQKKVAKLSGIFKWYSEDFGDTQEDLLKYLTAFLPRAAAEALRSHPEGWKIKYLPYNWDLNEAKKIP